MKKLKNISYLVVVLTLLICKTVFAETLTWENAPGHHNQSYLLESGITSSEDSVYRYARGDYLAEGYIEIVNNQNGTIGINAATLAHRNVDRILHTIFLDIWDADENDWIQLGYWEIEKTKEEVENEELYMLTTNLTLTGYEVNRYYRVRGLHGVEFNDELEACATETNGVLLTDWQN